MLIQGDDNFLWTGEDQSTWSSSEEGLKLTTKTLASASASSTLRIPTPLKGIRSLLQTSMAAAIWVTMVSVQAESRHLSVEEGTQQPRSHRVQGGKRRTEGDKEGTDGCLQFADDLDNASVVTADQAIVVATDEGPRGNNGGQSHGSAGEDREDGGETHRG